MTLSSLRNEILNHFTTTETLTVLEDLEKFKFPDEFSKNKLEMMISAMEPFEKRGVVRRITDRASGNVVGWILEQPIATQGQEVGLSYPVSNAIATVINSYLKENGGNEQYECDALNISEKDVFSLVMIINEMLEK